MQLTKGKKIIGIVGLILGLFLLYIIVSMFAGPSKLSSYTTLASDDVIEVRQYQEVMLAQVEVEGTRKQALEKGLNLLMPFFEGENSFNYEIPVHAPILQQEDERDENVWRIGIIIPEKYRGDELPKPNNEEIKAVLLPAQNYAVLEFCGRHTDKNINEHYEQLKAHLKKSKTIPKSKPLFAYYSPDWTFPWVRTIEVATYVPNDFQLAE